MQYSDLHIKYHHLGYTHLLTLKNKIPYSGKVWRAECLANLLFLSVWRKKVWRMNRSAIGLSMVGTAIRQIRQTFSPPNFPAIR